MVCMIGQNRRLGILCKAHGGRGWARAKPGLAFIYAMGVGRAVFRHKARHAQGYNREVRGYADYAEKNLKKFSKTP